jgi:hypothetical protein
MCPPWPCQKASVGATAPVGAPGAACTDPPEFEGLASNRPWSEHNPALANRHPACKWQAPLKLDCFHEPVARTHIIRPVNGRPH